MILRHNPNLRDYPVIGTPVFKMETGTTHLSAQPEASA